MTEQVKKGHLVKVHYTGTLEDGSVFDSSKDREPLEVLAGKGMLIKGFDDALVDMKPGDKKTFTIPKEEAYGDRKEELVRDISKQDIGDIEPKEGLTIGIKAPNGQVFPATITKVDGDSITLDANHPLAGQTLKFDIELVDTKEPSKEDMKKFEGHDSSCGDGSCGDEGCGDEGCGDSCSCN